MGVISLPEPNYKLKTKYKGNELTAGCKKLVLKYSVRLTYELCEEVSNDPCKNWGFQSSRKHFRALLYLYCLTKSCKR